MRQSVNIQGINCTYRSLRDGESVFYENLPKEEQYFRPQQHPFSDDTIVAIANKEHTYSAQEKAWVDLEKRRMTYGEGVYAYINGALKYLPASYWGYVNYWTLENGKKPEYREADRVFFLFMEYCCFETQLLSVTRGKGRRKGATSQGTYWEWWICGRNPEKIGGLVSYNDTSAQKIFTTMLMRGFKSLLPCFVEDFDSDSDNFLRFIKPVEKKKKGVPIKREGLNSYIDYQPTTLNSYDSGRVSFLTIDEFGKWEKVNVNVYWSKVSPTLTEGDEKVGFAYIPTTVNPKNKGGANYREFWNAANQFAIDPTTGEPFGENTPSRVVQYFDPATEGYAGCIDLYGDSVIKDPETPIMGNHGKLITQGSLSKIKNRRAQLDGERLMEHRRDFPLDVWDMFAFETGQCEFIEANLVARIQVLEEKPELAYWRQGRLYETFDDKGKLIANFADDPKGEWWVNKFPEIPNAYKVVGKHIEATNTIAGSGGADTYRNIFAEDGSEGVGCFMSKSKIVNGQETGLLPMAYFVGRPRLIKQFNRQMFLGCLWYGCKINYEIDAGTWFFEDFLEWGATGLLEWTPAIDLTNKNFKIKPGTESGNPFQLAKQLEVMKMYLDGTSIVDYNGHAHRQTYIPLLKQSLEYNHSERTPYHIVVATMMALLPILSQTRPPRQAQERKIQIMPTFKIRV